MAPKDIWDPKRRRPVQQPMGFARFFYLPKVRYIFQYMFATGSMGFIVDMLKGVLAYHPRGVLEPFSFVVLGTLFVGALVINCAGIRLRYALIISVGIMAVALANWPWMQLGFSPALWLTLTIGGLFVSLPLYGRLMEE